MQRLFAQVQAEYYEYWPQTIASGFGELQIVLKMGLPGWATRDITGELLADVDLVADARVAVVGCGSGLVPGVAAATAFNGTVRAVDGNYLSVTAACKTGELNGLSNLTVCHSDGMQAVHSEAFDVVLMRLPKEKQLAHQLVWDAFHCLEIGGTLYLAGANRGGIKTIGRMLRQVFGNVQTMQMRKGHRLLRALKSQAQAGTANPSPSYYDRQSLHLTIENQAFALYTKPGIFGWDKLDPGSAALLQVMDVRDGETVLDLGCGYGVVGVVATRKACLQAVYAVDAHWASVAMTAANFHCHARAGLLDYHVLAGDVIAPLHDVEFDIVLANPPFHTGLKADFATALAFLYGSTQVLRPGGRLFVVANRFLKYEPWLEQMFASVETVYLDNRFKVLKANQGS